LLKRRNVLARKWGKEGGFTNQLGGTINGQSDEGGVPDHIFNEWRNQYTW